MDDEFGSEQLQDSVFEEKRRLDIRGDKYLEGYWLAMFSYLLGGLEGKRILDIGCGGDYNEGRRWHPLFSRLAKNYGVDIVGLDPTINPENESFHAIRGYAEDLSCLFPPASFDGVLVANFWNQPQLIREKYEVQRTRNLQIKTYREISRILRSSGVSINHSNQDPSRYTRLFPPLSDQLLEIGFEVLYYFSGNEYGKDLIVLRKPVAVSQ